MARVLEPGDLVRYQEPWPGGQWFEARLIHRQRAPLPGRPDNVGWVATLTDGGSLFGYEPIEEEGRTVHLTGEHLTLLGARRLGRRALGALVAFLVLSWSGFFEGSFWSTLLAFVVLGVVCVLVVARRRR